MLSRVDAAGPSLAASGLAAASKVGSNSKRRAPPALPQHMRQWTAPAHARQAPARGATTLKQYQPTLDAALIDMQWQMAYFAAGRAGPPGAIGTASTPAAGQRQLCTPSALIARHMQSVLRAGFTQQPGVLFDRSAVASAAQARLHSAKPIRWRPAPMRVPPRMPRA